MRISANTSNHLVIRLKFADSSIICVWNFDNLTQSIHFDLESNTYILGEYDEYLYSIDNSKMAEYYSILGQILFEVEYFNREPSFFASPTIRLRLQRFVIRLDDKSQSGTQLHRSLVK